MRAGRARDSGERPDRAVYTETRARAPLYIGAVLDVVQEDLTSGKAVRLGGIGTLQVRRSRSLARATRASRAALTVRGWPAPFSARAAEGAAAVESAQPKDAGEDRRAREVPHRVLDERHAQVGTAQGTGLLSKQHELGTRGRRACRGVY